MSGPEQTFLRPGAMKRHEIRNLVYNENATSPSGWESTLSTYTSYAVPQRKLL